MPEILDKNLIKLHKLLAVVDEDTLTRVEFVSAFEQVVKLVGRIQERQAQAIAKLEETYAALTEKTKNDIADLKRQTNELFVGEQMKKMMKNHETMMMKIDEKLGSVDARIAKVKDGYTPKKGVDYFDGRPGYNAIIEPTIYKNLEYLMAKDKKKPEVPERFLGGVLNVGTRLETPSGTIDGQNRTFNFFKFPKWVCVDGINYFDGDGYSISGKVLTTTIAPTGFIKIFY